MNKLKQLALRIWKDPVWSKVISAGILVLIGLAWARITKHTWTEIYAYVIKALNFSIPIYLFLAAVALYYILVKTAQWIKKRKDPFWDEQMGNYTFKELYNILLTTKLPYRTVGMQWANMAAPDENLLFHFEVYANWLNTGVDFETRIDDGNYCYGIFAPKMVQYGLVDVFDKPDISLPDIKHKAYKTSDLGLKFLANMEKLKLKEIRKEIKNGKRFPNGELKVVKS